MTVEVDERLAILNEINRRAQDALTLLWDGASVFASDDFPTFITDAFPDLVDPWSGLAAAFAASWFEESDPASPYVAVTAPLPPTEKLKASTEWALSATGAEGRDRLSGTLQRAVFDGSRETTLVNVDQTRSKWARQALPNACEFCKLLATRNAAYSSRQSARRVVGRNTGRGAVARGTQKIGEKYHDHCFCIPVEVRAGQKYTPPPWQKEWAGEYQKARADAGSSDFKQVLAAWRRHDAARST